MSSPLYRSIAALLIAGLSTAALAEPFGENTVEQKATSAAEEKLQEIAELINKNCGTNIKITVDWKAYAPVYNSFTEDQRENRSLDNIYSGAEFQTTPYLRDVANYCKDEPIFKANVAKKLKSVTLQPSKEKTTSAKVPSHVFKLSNGVLNVTHHLFKNNVGGDSARKVF